MKISIFFSTLIMTGLVIAQNNAPDLKLKMVEEDSVYFIQARSRCHAPIDLDLKISETDSVVFTSIIDPFDSLIIWELGKGERSALAESFNSKYDIKYFLGDHDKIQPNQDYLYALPFKKGNKYPVSQGFNGKFSHKGISKYAIDFQLEIGEPVHAARSGLVIKVEDQFTGSGGKEFLFKANRILIQHDDGTIASYVHLNKDGALVSEGDYVEKGQHIGYSGNTGYTRGPHLHFVVRRGRDISIPVYFEGYEGQILKKRKRYIRRK